MLYKIPVSVLVIIFTIDYDILLLERADRKGFWQSVTGSKNTMSERLLNTAKREVREETGLELPESSFRDWNVSREFEIFKHWRGRYSPGVTHNREHVFSVMVKKTDNIRISHREHLSFIWCSREEAIKKVFSWTNACALEELPNYHRIQDS